MKPKLIDNAKHILAEDMEKYVQIILKEYEKFIPQERQEYLKSIPEYQSRIIVEDSGTISMFAVGNNVIMPLSAYKIFKYMKMIPGYGINKKHKSYEEGEILNNNTYYDYIKHVFISGMDVEEFFRDTLLHETMHFCGSGGGSALREGITEMKTRELAQKYGLKASRCGYPKEVDIANRFQNIVGEDIMNSIAFAENDHEIISILAEKCGTNVANLFYEISELMDNELDSKYDHSKFGGILGPIKKAKAYSQIDYSTIYEKLDAFEKGISTNNDFISSLIYKQNIYDEKSIPRKIVHPYKAKNNQDIEMKR